MEENEASPEGWKLHTEIVQILSNNLVLDDNIYRDNFEYLGALEDAARLVMLHIRNTIFGLKD